MIVTDATFKAEVLDSELPVLVDFWADWCGPCRQLAPILDSLHKEYGHAIKIAKLDVEANPQSMAQYGVTSLPTMNVFVNGEIVKTIIGAKPRGALVRELTPFLEEVA